MTLKSMALSAIALSCTLLAACGGDSTEFARSNHVTSGGNVINGSDGASALTPQQLAPFVESARTASCSSPQSRLLVIDKTMVLWDRKGNCADNASEQILYGVSSKAVKCTSRPTMAGPVVQCEDPADRPIFDMILSHIDSADLGLGSSHVIVPVDIESSRELFGYTDSILVDSVSAVAQPQNVVVRDTGGLRNLWAMHFGTRTMSAAPSIDFSRKMVVAVFAGQQDQGCRSVVVTKVLAGEGEIEVHYEVRSAMTLVACSESQSAPVAMVLINATKDPVTFIKDEGASGPGRLIPVGQH